MTDTLNRQARQLGPDLLDLLEPCIKSVNEARILPPVLYTSPEFYEFEREAVFGHEWLCVGRADQVPNAGDWFAVEMAGGKHPGDPQAEVADRGRDGFLARLDEGDGDLAGEQRHVRGRRKATRLAHDDEVVHRKLVSALARLV